MSEILEKAKAHFSDKLSGGMGEINVPEWGATIYFKPVNLEQRNTIYTAYKDKGLEMYIQMLITRALDSDGNRMFKNVDKLELRKHVDPDVIERICSAMEADEPDLETGDLKN